jgi:predicted Zn-dependent protease
MPPPEERGPGVDSLLREATDHFNDKKFGEAAPLFEKILKDGPQNSLVQFYYAVALLESGQTDKSRFQLIELYEGNSLFKYDAAFYMALSYLKEKNNDACKEWLKKIPDGAGRYARAQELMKEL